MRRGLASATVAALALLGCRTAPPPSPAAPQPPAASQPPAAEHYQNVLHWTTASEVDNFGYDVYRATKEEGPFERLTRDPIPGAGTIDVPQSYSFVDDTIDPRRAYYYYVESISLTGARARFTPVIRAKPKLPESVPPPGRRESTLRPHRIHPLDNAAAYLIRRGLLEAVPEAFGVAFFGILV